MSKSVLTQNSELTTPNARAAQPHLEDSRISRAQPCLARISQGFSKKPNELKVEGPEKAAPCGIQALREVWNAKTEAAFLMTQCKTEQYEFHAIGNREVVGHFDGGDITSDAGGLLLREVEQRTGIIRRFAACFRDRRDPRFTEFPVEELVAQRVFGLSLGYEDLNDHDQLRADPALAV